MRAVSRISLLLTVLSSLCLLTLAAAPSSADPPMREGELLIKFKDGTSSEVKNAILADLGASPIQQFQRIRAEHDRISVGSVGDAIGRYRNHPAIDFIEPNYIVTAVRTPNDPLFPQLWGLQNTGQTGGTPGADIHAADAWNIATGSPSVLVAIIDTGVDYFHPDLAANIYVNIGEVADNGLDDDGNGFVDDVRGWDFINDDNDPIDDNRHGTHCAGTVGGVGDNGIGVAGVNWSVRIMPLKFLGSGGSGSTADAVACIEYATMMGVHVMSNSWGGGGFSEALRLAIQDASDAGILFVAAAGNSNSNNDVFAFYPASYNVPNVIAVAATNKFDQKADFSSFGLTTVHLAAPGVDILSTVLGSSYGLLSGTSMATPHVAGILGLMKARFPLAPMASLKLRLFQTVDVLPSLSSFVSTGGRANAFRALADPDTIPPSAITDASVVEATSNTLRLRWTATGDDGAGGTASAYEVRYATAPLDESNFGTATAASGAPQPGPSGTTEEMEVAGLAFATTHYVAIRVIDELGNPSPISNVVLGTTLGPPALAFSPSSLAEALLSGAISHQSIVLSNVGEGTLDFSIGEERGGLPVTVHDYVPVARGETDPRVGSPVTQGSGGPDRFGYHWIDSDQSGGPTFDWVEISGIGTRIPMSALDANFGPIPIGFSFPFYGSEFTSLRACTHGWLSFTNTSTQFSNQPLPNPGAPENLLAAFWEDLNFSGVERAWYHNDGSRFIVEYMDVPATGGSGGPHTFQIILYPDGRIVYQYLSMGPFVAGATVGIQNAAQDDGLTIAFNTPYVHNGLAIQISRIPEWLLVSPRSGRVFAPESATLDAQFDATGLVGGVYSGAVHVRSNDPLQPEAVIPVQLAVTGVADIDASRASIDFGPLFVGGSRTDSLVVMNRGTQLLHVTELTASPSDFTVAPGSMDLPPGGRRTAYVTFRPTLAAPIGGTLLLRSDDPDEGEVSVSLAGAGLVPPDISINPTSLTDDLLSGESSTHAVAVRNDGGSDLLFDVDLGRTTFPSIAPAPTNPGRTPGEIQSSYEAYLANGAGVAPPTNPAPQPGVIPLWERLQASLADSFIIFFDDMESGVNGWTHYATFGGGDQWGQTTARRRSGVKSWQVTQHAGIGADALQSPSIDLTGLVDAFLGFHHWYNFDDCGGDPTFEPDGGIVEISQNEGASWVQIYPLTGYPYVLDDVCGNPLAFRQAYSHDGGVGGSFVPAVFDLTPYVGGPLRVRFHAGWDCGNCGPNEGWFIDDVTVSSRGPRFVTVTPEAGTLGPGSSIDLAVTIDATGLFGGNYTSEVIVRSNDPDENLLTVPVAVHVTGAPDIAWSPESLEFGAVFLGGARSDTIDVVNAGTDVLHVAEILTDHPDFSVSGGPSLTLAPGGSAALVVTFTPSAPVTVAASLVLRSDDADEGEVHVPLHGTGIIPPDVSVDPSSLTAAVQTGETAERTLTVRNTGGSDLSFEVLLSEETSSAPSGTPVPVPETLRGPTANVTNPGAAPPAVQAEYQGTHLRFGISEYGEIMPFQAPVGTEHLRVGSFLSGYTLAYVSSGVDRVAYALHFERLNIVPVSYEELENTGSRVVVEVITRTTDGLLEIRRLITFPRDLKYVRVKTTLQSLSPSAITNVVFKEDADWDVDNDFEDDSWDYDRGRNMVFAWDQAYVAIGSAETPALMDLFGWGDVLGRTTTVDFPVGPVHGLDGLEVLHFELGDLAASQFREIATAYGTGASLSELRDVMDEAVSPISWLAVDPPAGTVAAGGTAQLRVTFDPGTLRTGDYAAQIGIASNDPDEARVNVPASMHVTGVPIIAVEPSSLEFDSLYVGQSATRSLTVRNTGTETLVVTAMTADDASYSTNLASFAVPPFAFQAVTVTFAPSLAGVRSGTLAIAHNAAGSPASVALHGVAVTPPVITLSPTSIHADLATEETRAQILTLGNVGGSDLRFDLRALNGAAGVAVSTDSSLAKGEADTRVGNPVTSGSGGPDLFGYRWIDSDEPGGPAFSWTDIAPVGTPIPIAGDDQISGPIPIGFSFPFYGTEFTSVRVCTNGFLSFTSDFPEYSNQPLPHAFAPENMLAAFWDDLFVGSSSHVYYRYDGTRFVVQFQNVYHLFAGGPYTFQIILFPTGTFLFQYLSMAPSLTQSTVGIQNGARNDGLTVVFNQSYIHDQLAIRFSSAPSWLTISPLEGVVPAGGQSPIDVTLNATGLFPGDYAASIDVLSNDPVTPEGSVPVTLHVLGVPDLFVSPTSLDFDSLYVGETRDRVLQVANLGTDRLLVTDIQPGIPDYSITPRTFELAPMQSRSVTVTFTAATAGNRATLLTLISNDPDSPTLVPVAGVSLIPPVIAAQPAIIEAAAMPGGQASRSLTICNQGGSDLRFRIQRPGLLSASHATSPRLSKGEPDPRPGILGTGDADAFGHVWVDSDEPGGPAFEWIDISEIGVRVPFNANADDENRGPYPIGFTFPYYGNLFTQFRVCTNGWISFTSSSTSYFNDPLPYNDPQTPENLLAVLWDDLVVSGGGAAVYYHADGQRLIVQFHNLIPLGLFSPVPHAFEVILYPSGEIVYQYLTVGAQHGGITVGMQDASKTDGLTVAFNTVYLHPNMAVRITEPARWVDVSPLAGSVAPGGCMPVEVEFDASELEPGDYTTLIRTTSNDPANPTITTEARLHVRLIGAAAAQFDPNSLNQGSNGRYVTTYVELPPEFDPARVVLSTVRYQGTLPVAQGDALSLGDFNDNGVPDLHFRFDRAAVEALLPMGDAVPVEVTGEIENVAYFAARDTIRVIRPHVTTPNGGELLVSGTTHTVRWANPQGWNPLHAAIYYSLDADSTWTVVAEGVEGLSFAWLVPAANSTTVRLRVYLYDAQGVMGYDASDDLFAITPSVTAVELQESGSPAVFALHQNAPNPFNPATVIRFDLPEAARIRLDIFQVDGRLARTLLAGHMPAGPHGIRWDGRDSRGRPLPSGVYIYRLRAGAREFSRRMLMVK